MKFLTNLLSGVVMILFMMMFIAGSLSILLGFMEFLSWCIFGQFFHFF